MFNKFTHYSTLKDKSGNLVTINSITYTYESKNKIYDVTVYANGVLPNRYAINLNRSEKTRYHKEIENHFGIY